jgi:hypothetical protein
MPDQTYASVGQQPPTVASTSVNLEPEQVTGVPTQATEVDKTEVLQEIGGSGTAILNGFLTNQDYNPEFTGTKRITLFDQMRLSDPSVRSGLLAVKLPLLSADWYIKEPSGDDELGEPAKFINDQLFKNKGFSWTSFLRQALTMVDYGNSIFEKVFETTPEGKIGWKRLSPRMSKTIHRWTLQDGKSPGIYQILPTGKTAEIPRWKLLYFVNEQEGSNFEGISMLRPAYQPYYYKQLLYKIDAIASEKQGMGIPKITAPPNAAPADKAKAREIAQNMRTNEKAYLELPAGFNIEFMDMKGVTVKDCKGMIEHYDREIVKAFLAQFLDLGAKAGGSYALSQDQSRLFLLGLEYIAKVIQEEMNKAIRELCDLNFPNLKDEEYPTLEYGAIGQVDFDALSTALQRLAQSQIFTPDIETEKYLRSSMKLPIPENLDELREQKQEQNEQRNSSFEHAKAGIADEDDEDIEFEVDDEDDEDEPKKPAKRTAVQATEFMRDMLEFKEQLETAIAQKRNHAVES